MSAINLTGLNILVLEDDSVLRKRITARLEALGADVVGGESVAAARRFLAQRGFDYVFLDVNLPDGKGTDLLAEKAFPPGTGVIVVTAHGAVAGAVEAMRLGALDYLVKPFDVSELGIAVERVQTVRRTARISEH